MSEKIKATQDEQSRKKPNLDGLSDIHKGGAYVRDPKTGKITKAAQKSDKTPPVKTQ